MKKFKVLFSVGKVKSLYRPQNFREAYELIKVFGIDVFLNFKKGAQEHTKAIKTSLVL